MIRACSLWLGTAILSACAGSGVPQYFPIPEDAENPIVMEYAGASAAEITDIVAKVCSDIPIATAQVRPNDGYVETRWADIAALSRDPQAEMYPLRERSVVYTFQVTATGDRAGNLQIAGYYQPNRPTGTSPTRDSRYDRLLPKDHPGYQLALQIEWRLKQQMRMNRITVVGEEQES
ncbi:MAG: hypothetical protein PVJ43_12215 [Gemmatimonadales bacterium]|jgi:hypothetical protein